ncbi:MAG: winged helix-turn-helix transcriptional regulator, partial [Bacteroidales bacterium]|nr:winged helix-turn-helix transcriptional regulator [Bacteroidales bacterium]
VLGYVNRFSRGVYRVQKELKENGNGEAKFDFSLRTAFRVVENISKRYFEEGFGADIPENAQETPKKRPRNAQETPKNIQGEIIEAIKLNPSITRKELESLLGRSRDSIKYHLAQLVKNGIVKHEGSTKAGKWIVIE